MYKIYKILSKNDSDEGARWKWSWYFVSFVSSPSVLFTKRVTSFIQEMQDYKNQGIKWSCEYKSDVLFLVFYICYALSIT